MAMPVFADNGDVPIHVLIERAQKASVFAFDLETTSTDPRNGRIKGASFYVPEIPGVGETRAWYPFVRGTMCVDLYECPECGLKTFDPFDEAIKRRRNGLIVCRECDVTAAPRIVDVRDPLDCTETFEALQPLFLLENVVCVGFNMKFDEKFVRLQSGVEPEFRFLSRRADGMLAAFLQDERYQRYGLKPLAKKFFDVDLATYQETDVTQHAFSFMRVQTSKKRVRCLGTYAMDDAEYHYKVFDESITRCRDQDPGGRLEKLFWDMEMKIQWIIEEMELAGVPLDWRHLAKVSKDLEEQKNHVYGDIQKTVEGLGWTDNYNPNSPPQTSDLLFNSPAAGGLGLPTDGIEPGKAGAWPTGDKVIRHFAPQEPVVAAILKWRSLDTLKKSFADKLTDIGRRDGRLYSGFNQTRTVVGRLSSSNPVNLQNQPRQPNLIRYAFCAHLPDEDSDMTLFGADYGQVELRVAAHLSNDPVMVSVYSSPICDCEVYLASKAKNPDEPRCEHIDLHTRTAVAVDVPRNPLAKNLNFGLLYRMGAAKFCVYAGLFDSDGNPRVNYARGVIKKWFDTYVGITWLHSETEQWLRRNDWIAYTLTGRRRRLDEEAKKNEYLAVTKGIQFRVSGTAQDIMKVGMMRIAAAREEKIRSSGPATRRQWQRLKFFIQVHDEILMSGPKHLDGEIKELIEEAMAGAADLRVPLTVVCKSGRTWDDVH